MAGRAKVSLCLIVRNEENNLRPCLTPVSPLVDEVIVVDTGSTDGTREVAAQLGARVFEFPWCDDFAAARNHALDRTAGDWIIWLDADDRLDAVNSRRLGDLLAKLDDAPRAYFMACVNVPRAAVDPATVIQQCRLFRRDPAIRWERRVHEQIVPSLERAGHPILASEVRIHHIGYQDPILAQRKANRDLRLLRLEYAADPADPVTLFNLGLVHRRLGQHSEALTAFLYSHKYVATTAAWVRCLYTNLGEVLLTLGRLEEALALTAEGLQRFPGDAVLLTRRAEYLAAHGDLGGAERCLVQLLRDPQGPHAPAGDQTILDLRSARFLLGMIYQSQNRCVEAERVFQELIAQSPTYVQAWIGLGQVYLTQRKFPLVEYVAQQLEKCDPGGVSACVLRAERHLAQDELEPAHVLLTTAIERAPQMVWPRLVLGDWLIKSGSDPATCIAAQREVLRLAPGNARATANLNRLLQPQARQPAAAALCFTITI